MTSTTILNELLKDITTVESTPVVSTPKISQDDYKEKRKAQYNKTRDKTLLQKKTKYQENKKKLSKIKGTLEQAFREIPDSELVLLTSKRVIISKNKMYKLVYKIVRR